MDYALNIKNRLITTAEVIHRTDKKGKGLSGRIISLSGFVIDGRKYKQNWVRGTLGIEHTMDIGRVTLTLNISSQGEDQHYWSGLNYSVAF